MNSCHNDIHESTWGHFSTLAKFRCLHQHLFFNLSVPICHLELFLRSQRGLNLDRPSLRTPAAIKDEDTDHSRFFPSICHNFSCPSLAISSFVQNIIFPWIINRSPKALLPFSSCWHECSVDEWWSERPFSRAGKNAIEVSSHLWNK